MSTDNINEKGHVDPQRQIDTGGLAYPSEQGSTPEGTWNQTYDPGMTYRMWLAGMAMQALLSSSDWQEVDYGDIGIAAYKQADALIAELAKDTTQ